MANAFDCGQSNDIEKKDLPIEMKPFATGSPVKKKPIVAKSTPLATVRKFRRLDSTVKATDNPLFQPWTTSEAADFEVPMQKSPTKGPKRSRLRDQNISYTSQDSLSLLSELDISQIVRPSHLRQPISAIRASDDSGCEIFEENILSEPRIRRLGSNLWPSASDVMTESHYPDLEGRKRKEEKSSFGGFGLGMQQPHRPRPENVSTEEVIGASNFHLPLKAPGTSDWQGQRALANLSFDVPCDEDQSPLLAKPLTIWKGQFPPYLTNHALSKEAESVLQPRHINQRTPEPRDESKANISQINAVKPLTMKTNEGTNALKIQGRKNLFQRNGTTDTDLANTFAELRLQFCDKPDISTGTSLTIPPTIPKRTLPVKQKSNDHSSPRKQVRIISGNNLPSVDSLSNSDESAERMDRHSPRIPVLAPSVKRLAKVSEQRVEKSARKLFDTKKLSIAENFLVQLDSEITGGKIADLAKLTGGVKLVWTRTLNTTAGRANWKREAVSTKQIDGMDVGLQYKHFASIELAEKVIDNEHRLLNVLAHEFCHLANFMISGVTNNPHGKDFKIWAAKCSSVFEAQGVHVTTKHTYHIDFKYLWECMACGSEYKRHSKSIDPRKHKCGQCNNILKQTKPIPRVTASGKPSDYQVFVKEQMKTVKEQNPGTTQRDVMRMIAERWSKRERPVPTNGVEDLAVVVSQLASLDIVEHGHK